MKKEAEGLLYSLKVYKEPVAQGRARSTIIASKKHGKQFVSHYDPAKSRNYKDFIRKCIISKPKPANILDVPLIMTCKVYKLRPKSVKKNLIFVKTKPDLSNYIKGIEDALEGLIIRNDSVIVGYHDCWKLYCDELPRVEIELWEAVDPATIK